MHLGLLDRAHAEAASAGFACYPWFESDPLLAPLRGNPAFTGFLEEFKQVWETKKAQLAAVQ